MKAETEVRTGTDPRKQYPSHPAAMGALARTENNNSPSSDTCAPSGHILADFSLGERHSAKCDKAKRRRAKRDHSAAVVHSSVEPITQEHDSQVGHGFYADIQFQKGEVVCDAWGASPIQTRMQRWGSADTVQPSPSTTTTTHPTHPTTTHRTSSPVQWTNVSPPPLANSNLFGCVFLSVRAGEMQRKALPQASTQQRVFQTSPAPGQLSHHFYEGLDYQVVDNQ